MKKKSAEKHMSFEIPALFFLEFAFIFLLLNLSAGEGGGVCLDLQGLCDETLRLPGCFLPFSPDRHGTHNILY